MKRELRCVHNYATNPDMGVECNLREPNSLCKHCKTFESKRIIKYYHFVLTNLGMGWWRWTPKYLKKNTNKDKAYFFLFNWRITWWYTTEK
jgi:hypothetical protein